MQRSSVLERDQQNGKIQRRSTRLHSSSGIPRQPRTGQQQLQEQVFLSEIMRIPPTVVAQLKQKLGLDGKELTAMAFDEKRRLVEEHRQRIQGDASSSSETAMASNEEVRKRSQETPSESSPAPPDILEPPFTFEFIRSVVDTMEKFDPSANLPPVDCCHICGDLYHSYSVHLPPLSNSAFSAGPDMSAAPYTPDFMPSVTNSLDEFDLSFLGPNDQ